PLPCAQQRACNYSATTRRLVHSIGTAPRPRRLLPYDQYMHRFAAYFQQGDMESNGKSVTSDAAAPGHPLWYRPTSSAVHTHNPISGGVHHQILLSNCLAQTQALAFGKTLAEAETELRKSGVDDAVVAAIAAHKVFEGNRPTNSVLF
uniref:Glucose-6-phosphate isomerase n=1 Tax=Macrostomum lignano TaxID=282301 RepID=A0A1I8FR44_9PLAT